MIDMIRRHIKYLEQIARQAPCGRCGHQKSYHGPEECGQEVCATGPHGGGGYCDDEMHGAGWCLCPAWIEESDHDE